MSRASVLNCSIYFWRYLLTNISTRNSLTILYKIQQSGNPWSDGRENKKVNKCILNAN